MISQSLILPSSPLLLPKPPKQELAILSQTTKTNAAILNIFKNNVKHEIQLNFYISQSFLCKHSKVIALHFLHQFRIKIFVKFNEKPYFQPRQKNEIKNHKIKNTTNTSFYKQDFFCRRNIIFLIQTHQRLQL